MVHLEDLKQRAHFTFNTCVHSTYKYKDPINCIGYSPRLHGLHWPTEAGEGVPVGSGWERAFRLVE